MKDALPAAAAIEIRCTDHAHANQLALQVEATSCKPTFQRNV